MKKSSKAKFGGIKIKPLAGRHFDIKPPAKGPKTPALGFWKEYTLFVILSVIGLTALLAYSAVREGSELILKSKAEASEGVSTFQAGLEALKKQDVENASALFQKARWNFEALESETDLFNQQASALRKESAFLDTANKLVDSALIVSDMGQQITQLLSRIRLMPEAFAQAQESRDRAIQFMEDLRSTLEEFEGIYQKVIALQNNLTTLNTAILPQSLKSQISSAQSELGDLLFTLKESKDYISAILTLVGDKTPHRYLVLFQNSNERRATGGFIGSYMIVDINDGYIEKMEARDVYDTDGRLTTVIDPPPGIDRVADRYYMRDANYNPDFPTSARQIAWFLEESKGPSADTVIAIDQGVMEEVLNITGPLAVPGFPFQLKPETFTQIVSFYVEAKLSGSGSPKQILFDMIPILKRKLLEGGNPEKLISLIRTLAAEGHVQAFSFSDQVQALFRVLKFDGAMMKPEAGVDYLSVISTSIGGNKSDAYIQQTLRHSTEINKEGQVENTLKIHKAHTWAANDDAQIDTLIRRYGAGETDPYTLKKILGKGDNLDYMRVYVPPGARLLSAEGIELNRVTQSEINGYTVFAFIFGPVEAGGGQAITLKYSLPFRIESRYRLAVDKQAGAEQVTIKKGFKLPESLRFISAIPDGMDANTESVGDLDQDKFYQLIFEQ